jgi:hypothetical protein
MLGEKDSSFSTTGWTQVETLARERPKVIMTAFGVGTADTRHALEIVGAGAKPLAELLDALKAVPAVRGGVLFIVPGAEVAEVPPEDDVEVIATTGNVPFPSRDRDRDRCAHMNVYGRKRLPASDRGPGHRASHNMAHPPDAFSSLRSCEGAGDARR